MADSSGPGLDVFWDELVESLASEDGARLSHLVRRVTDCHEDNCDQAALLHTALESSSDAVKLRFQGLPGLDAVRKIASVRPGVKEKMFTPKDTEAQMVRRRWNAFLSILEKLGPALLTHHGWIPSSDTGSGTKFMEELRKSLKRTNDTNAWKRRLNAAIYHRLHKQKIQGLRQTPDTETFGSKDSLVKQADLIMVSNWGKSTNRNESPPKDEHLTRAEMVQVDCTMNDFGILAERKNSDSPGSEPGHVRACRTKRPYDGTHIVDGIAPRKRHQDHTALSDRTRPQLPTPDPSVGRGHAPQQRPETQRSQQQPLTRRLDRTRPQLSTPDPLVGRGHAPQQRPETQRSQQQPLTRRLGLANASEVESNFKWANANIRAHLAKLGNKLSEDHVYFDAADQWFGPAELATYTTIDDDFDVSSIPDCDLYKVFAGENGEGQDRFRDLLENEKQPFILDRPVHITGERFRRDTTAEELAKQLVRLGTKVESFDYSDGNKKLEPKEFLDKIQLENTSLGAGEEDVFWERPLNALGLKSAENLQTPDFLSVRHGIFQRFDLLPFLAKFVENLSEKAIPSDLATNHQFQLLATSLAFSGAHVDILGGTWIRVHDGEKLWLFASKESSTDKDFEDLVQAGERWVPRKPRVVVLKTGDIFYMPAGTRTIHAPLTLRPCHIRGGMIWDRCAILPMLKHLAETCKNLSATNDYVPYELPYLIDALQALAESDNCSSFAQACGMEASEFSKKFYSAIEEVRSVGCKHEGHTACTADCACRKPKGGSCTRFCDCVLRKRNATKPASSAKGCC